MTPPTRTPSPHTTTSPQARRRQSLRAEPRLPAICRRSRKLRCRLSAFIRLRDKAGPAWVRTVNGQVAEPVYAGVVRLVSLLPSATEIVYALGLGDDLVGVTFECDEPPQARADKTVVVGGRDTTGMAPGEIDRYVRAQLAAGADLYTLHARALTDLKPDLILTQDLCRVCALPSRRVEDALDYLGCQADVLSLDPHSLAEVLDSILTVGRRAGVPDRAARLATGLRARLARVAEAVDGRRRPRVAVVEWVDPPFTAGHWVPDLVTAAGGQPVAARPVPTNWDAIAAAAPDLVVAAPCGYHLADAIGQAQSVARALPGLPVWAIDADGIVVRPGPRLVDGVEAIDSILHPDAVPAPPPGAVHQVTAPAPPEATMQRPPAVGSTMLPRCCRSTACRAWPARWPALSGPCSGLSRRCWAISRPSWREQPGCWPGASRTGRRPPAS